MAKVLWGMIMSVDGFINDRHGSLDKLYASFEPNDEINAAMANTGAVVMGRSSFDSTEDTDAYADNYEFQVPLFTNASPAGQASEGERELNDYFRD